MKLCVYCQTTLPDNASVCEQCGRILPDEEDITISRSLAVSPDDLLAKDITVSTDDEDATIKGWPTPIVLEDKIINDMPVPNPETPIPDMALLDNLADVENLTDTSADSITDDPTPTPTVENEADAITDDPAPLISQDWDAIDDDPTPVPSIQHSTVAADDDPMPAPIAAQDADAIIDDPTPALHTEQDDDAITDDPTPVVSGVQQDAEAISSDSAPLLENQSDSAIILADAPIIETDPNLLAATLETLGAVSAHDDPTPVGGQPTALPVNDNASPSGLLDGSGEDTTLQNGSTAPAPLYPDYGKAKKTAAVPLYGTTTGQIADGQPTSEEASTKPVPLFDNYKEVTSPLTVTGSFMRLPQKIYTAYPQLLSRSGLISLTLCLLLIISSIGLIIVKRPESGPGKSIYPIAAKLVLNSSTLSSEVIKGLPTIVPVVIGNSGKQPLHWLATHKNAPWLSLSKQSGTINTKEPDQTVYAKASTATLAEGLHSGSIQFQTSGGDGSVQISINVLPANGKKQPFLNVDPPTLTFDTLSQDQQVTKTLTISNTGNAPLKWSANTDNPSWLSLSPTSGTILAGGYPQPLVLTVHTATLPPGGNTAQLTIISNASKTPQTLGITINVTPSNENALTISTDPGSFTNGCLECVVMLTAARGGQGSKSSVNWSTASAGVAGITFNPSSGTLLAGQSIPVKVTVPNTICPASAYFNFIGTANSVPVLWSCTPPPSPIAVLTASPTDLTNCTTCTVYISPAASSQSKLNWTSYSSGINGIKISPSKGTVAPGNTMPVTITVPPQNCPASASLIFLGQGPNNAATLSWSCVEAPLLAPLLSVTPSSLKSSHCQANSDGTYNCSVTLSESPAGDMGWSSFSSIGGNFSLTTGQFSAGSTSVQVSINNIPCQDGSFGFLGSNNQAPVQWTCMSKPPALTIDTNKLSPNSGNCVQDTTYGYDCVVTLGESFGGPLNWNESDTLGLAPSQSSGQLTSDNRSQQVSLYYIPCQSGTITFSATNSNKQRVKWICNLPTPSLSIDTTSLSPTSANCSNNNDGTYYCVLNLGESAQGTLNWSESDSFGSNSYISQRNGTLTPSSPTAQIIYYNIPCVQSGSITFSTSTKTINVSWACMTKPSPTPTPTPITPILSVDQTSLSDQSPNCSANGDGTYFCYLNLSESPQGTLNWNEADNLGTPVSQTSGTLTPSSPTAQIYFYNIPCNPGQGRLINLTTPNSTSITVNWSCSIESGSPPPMLTIDTNNLSPNSGNCAPDPSNGYDCTVNLGESSAGTLSWYETDNLGPYVAPSSGQLTQGSPNQPVTLYYLPCQMGSITFVSPNNVQSVNWTCSPPPPVNLSVSPSSIDPTNSNCHATDTNIYSCQVALSEDQSVTTNWSANDDYNLGVSFSSASGTLNSSDSPQYITISNIPCQDGTFTFYSESANSATTAWNCTPSSPTPTPSPSPTVTPNLSVNPSNIDPTNSSCSSSGNNFYSCTVALSEDQSASINWNVSDDNSLGVSFSQSSGTLSSGNTSQSITISNIPCQSDTFTFSGTGANAATVNWSCTPSGPTPTPSRLRPQHLICQSIRAILIRPIQTAAPVGITSIAVQ